MSFVPYLNFLSRWLLFLAIAYKAASTKEKSWVLLGFAAFVDALNIESYILTPLGLTIKPDAYDVAGKIPNFFIAALLGWGAIKLKRRKTTFKDTLYIGLFLVTAYIWVFLLATQFFDRFPHSFFLRSIYPSTALGASMIFLGYVFRDYVISKRSLEELFPWGFILLGALNLTYPVTRPIEWFARFAFFAAAIFRLMAAIGALVFVMYPLKSPHREPRLVLQSRALIFTKEEAFMKKFPNLFKEANVILITRKDPKWIQEHINRHNAVFWITKIREGEIEGTSIYAISPTKIDILIDLVNRELDQGYNVVYMDVFEYLIIENSFEAALKFLLSLRDRVLAHNAALILILNLKLLDKRQRAILMREFEVVE